MVYGYIFTFEFLLSKITVKLIIFVNKKDFGYFYFKTFLTWTYEIYILIGYNYCYYFNIINIIF